MVLLPASAQQCLLTGRVCDAETGEPLAGAIIEAQPERARATTDNEGLFRMHIGATGSQELITSYLGYQNKRTRINAEGKTQLKKEIYLTPTPPTLKEVVVMGKTESRRIRERAMPVTVLTAAQLAGSVSNVSDILSKTMGVTTRSMGGAVNIVIKEYPPCYLDVSYTIGSHGTHKISSVLKRNLAGPGLEIGGGGFYTHADNDYTMESPFQKGLTIKRDHDRFNAAAGAIGLKARKWYFDELKLTLEGITNNKQKIEGEENCIWLMTTYYAGNGKLYATADVPKYWADPKMPNYLRDRSVVALEIDIYKKTVKKLPIPHDCAYASHVTSYDDVMLFSVYGENASGFYSYAPKTGKASDSPVVVTKGYAFWCHQFK